MPPPPSPLHLLGNIYVLAKCGEITQSVPDLGEKIRPRRMATMPMTAERMFDFWRSSKIYRKLLAISNRRVWKFENLYIKLKIPSLSLFHSTSLSVYPNAMMIIQNINFCFIYFTVKFRQVGVSSWPGAKDKVRPREIRLMRERECCARESGRVVRACIKFITIRFSFIYKHRGEGKGK